MKIETRHGRGHAPACATGARSAARSPLLVANRDYANWEERMNPWPVEARGRRGPPAAARPRRPGRRPEVRPHRRPQRPRARQRPRDRRPRRRRRAGQGASCARSASSVLSHVIQIGSVQRPSARRPRARRTSPASTSRRSAASTPRRARRWSSEINRLRKANESLGGVFEVRAFGARARARLARLLGGAPRRPPRPARSPRSRRSRASRSATASTSPGAPGSRGPRRDLLRRASAATTARPTAPAASRAA